MSPNATAPQPTNAATPRPRAVRWALGGVLGALAVLACLVVFGLYTAPDFMVMLADQMWACF